MAFDSSQFSKFLHILFSSVRVAQVSNIIISICNSGRYNFGSLILTDQDYVLVYYTMQHCEGIVDLFSAMSRHNLCLWIAHLPSTCLVNESKLLIQNSDSNVGDYQVLTVKTIQYWNDCKM